jgi:diaminopimelate decarboxylase
MTLSDLVRPARTAAIGDSDTPHLFERYRDAMPGIGIACPAQRLQTPATTRWVKKHGLSVAAYSSSELALAISSGIEPSRLVAYGEQARWGPIRCAVNAGVRQFVVDTEHVGDAVAAICDSAHLDLVGLHFEQDQGSSGAHRYAVAVDAMVALLTLIHVRRGLIATRLSLAGPVWNSPRAVAAVIETATEDSCARHHFPRPSLAFTPR